MVLVTKREPKLILKFEVDGKTTKNQISLKVEGGDQFAQVAGVGWEKQVEIWGKLGLDVSKKEKRLYGDI